VASIRLHRDSAAFLYEIYLIFIIKTNLVVNTGVLQHLILTDRGHLNLSVEALFYAEKSGMAILKSVGKTPDDQ
jgi:hypothetical protein